MNIYTLVGRKGIGIQMDGMIQKNMLTLIYVNMLCHTRHALGVPWSAGRASSSSASMASYPSDSSSEPAPAKYEYVYIYVHVYIYICVYSFTRKNIYT